MLLPDPTSSWLFKPINSRILSKDAMLDEHPSLCELWPKLFFSLTEELSPKACQSRWCPSPFSVIQESKECSKQDRSSRIVLRVQS